MKHVNPESEGTKLVSINTKSLLIEKGLSSGCATIIVK